MIRIHRGREPGMLPPIRSAELARVRPLVHAKALDRHNIGTRYDEVKTALQLAQHYKCCYCERNNLEALYLDVEHYRPKLQALRGAGFPDHGYWWLAWNWNNLLFSCQPCNRSFKSANFPLDTGSGVLVAEQQPPGTERPLLIDPAYEDPIGHIKFTLHPNLSHGKWRPLPRNGSPVGNQTIRVLGLDRPGLLDLYDVHVAEHVWPAVNRLDAAMFTTDRAAVAALWKREALGWLRPVRPFTALSYDAFDHYVPFATRRRWGLRLPRPR